MGAADFCRFLSYSGCRIDEVARVTWASVNWEKKQLRVKGFKSDTSDRVLPLFAELEALLLKVRERRKKAAVFAVDGKPILEPADPVFRLSECQKTMDKACETTGVARITHHDFRRLFATRYIESGVDIQTVSRWLGHADGGALAMKTYGHLRQEHSQAQAQKVSFGGYAMKAPEQDWWWREDHAAVKASIASKLARRFPNAEHRKNAETNYFFTFTKIEEWPAFLYELGRRTVPKLKSLPPWTRLHADSRSQIIRSKVCGDNPRVREVVTSFRPIQPEDEQGIKVTRRPGWSPVVLFSVE